MLSAWLKILLKYIPLQVILFLLWTFQLNAKEVSQYKAETVARSFIAMNLTHFEAAGIYTEATFKSIYTHKIEGLPYYYVFKFEGGGFIIVSAEDLLSPVLGYSYTGDFLSENQADNVRGWMLNYISMIDSLRDSEYSQPGEIRQRWDRLLNEDGSTFTTGMNSGNRVEVEPLIQSNWAQDIPYNTLCPSNTEGPGGRCVTGCVATAIAQIMYYWRYPLVGTGSKSYSIPGYGVLSADFGNTYYNWSAMKDELTNNSGSAPILAVSQLQYHIGIAAEMYYQPDGSSATNTKAIEALKNHFNYAESANIAKREFFDPTSWKAIIKTNLEIGRPIYYAGDNGSLGHAFVCDGYQTGDVTYFHFNFGWGGNNDGYYWIDDPFGFTNNQEIIRNIYPDTENYTYPYYCNGPSYITVASGSFEDGSGPIEDYENNRSCSWTIAPQKDSVSYFTIDFDQFDVAEGDTLVVYDGNTLDNEILGKFTGNRLPNSFNTSGGTFLVTFTSNNSMTSAGWELNYKGHLPDYCAGLIVLNEASGTINDGSGSKHYTENTLCRWKIDIPDAEKITFGITQIDTEETYDYIHVHDLSTNRATELGKFSGNSIPEPVTGKGPLLITFKTNNCVNKSGWKAFYSKGEASVEESMVRSFKIFPNPASDELYLSIDLKSQSKVKIELINNMGHTVLKQEKHEMSEKTDQRIALPELPAGLYILRLSIDKESINRRIIIL